MQLTNTTDYAIRIVCYLASENKVITTAELSRELNIPASYIPKITKQLKEKEIVKAAEGSNGGYMLEKGNKLVCGDENCGYVENRENDENKQKAFEIK